MIFFTMSLLTSNRIASFFLDTYLLYRSKIPTNPTPLLLLYRISNGIREVIPTALIPRTLLRAELVVGGASIIFDFARALARSTTSRAAIAPRSASLAEDGASGRGGRRRGRGGRAGGRGRGRARTGRTGDHDASCDGRIVRVVCLVNDSRGIDRHPERVSASWYARGINPLPIEGVAVNVGPVREFLL